MAYRDLRAKLTEPMGAAVELTPQQRADAKIQQILLEIAEATGLAEVEGYVSGPNTREDHTVIVYDKFSVSPRR
jgi:hypothetical protein